METEIAENQYTIKIGSFEGPFALLLSLVEERKLFINDVSLAEVTEDYINYIKTLNKLDPVQISGFIVVAATLILIKSKSLLPNLNLSTEEEGDIRSLEERLRLYKIFTDVAMDVKKAFGRKVIFAPLERKNATLVFLPDEQITSESMMAFVYGAIDRIPKKTFLPPVEVKKVISIEEMKRRLTERIESSLKMNFREFAGRVTNREEKLVLIVSFLAMLELARQGILNLVQDNNFEDIFIEKQLQEQTETIEQI
jgi:segregation and condensation protein A